MADYEDYQIGVGYVKPGQQARPTGPAPIVHPQRQHGMAPRGAGQIRSDDFFIDLLSRPDAWRQYLINLNPWHIIKREFNRMVITPEEWIEDPGQAVVDLVGNATPYMPAVRSIAQGFHDVLETLGERRRTGEFGTSLPLAFWQGVGEGMPEFAKTHHGYPLLRGLEVPQNYLADALHESGDWSGWDFLHNIAPEGTPGIGMLPGQRSPEMLSVNEITRRTLFPEVYGESPTSMFKIGYGWIVPGDANSMSWMRRAAGSAVGMGLDLGTDPLIWGTAAFSVVHGTARGMAASAGNTVRGGLRGTFGANIDRGLANEVANTVRRSVMETVTEARGGRGINPRHFGMGYDTAVEPIRQAIGNSLAPLEGTIGRAGVQGLTELTLGRMVSDTATQLRFFGRPIRNMLREVPVVPMYSQSPEAGYQQLMYEFGPQVADDVWAGFSHQRPGATHARMSDLIERHVPNPSTQAINRVVTATDRGLAGELTPIGPEDVFARAFGPPFGETQVPGLVRGLHRRAGRLSPTVRAIRKTQAIERGMEELATYHTGGRPSAAEAALRGDLTIEDIVGATRAPTSPETVVRFYQNMPHSHRVTNAIQLGQGGSVVINAEATEAWFKALRPQFLRSMVAARADMQQSIDEDRAGLMERDLLRQRVGLPTVGEVSETIAEARSSVYTILRDLATANAAQRATAQAAPEAPETPLLQPAVGHVVEEAPPGPSVQEPDFTFQMPEAYVQVPGAETAFQDLSDTAQRAIQQAAQTETVPDYAEVVAQAEVAAQAGMTGQDIETTIQSAYKQLGVSNEDILAEMLAAVQPITTAVDAAAVVDPTAEDRFAVLEDLSPEDQAELVRLGMPTDDPVDWSALSSQRWAHARDYLDTLREAKADAEDRIVHARSQEEEEQWQAIRHQISDAERGRDGVRKARDAASRRQKAEVNKRLEAARGDAGMSDTALWHVLAEYFGGTAEMRMVDFINAVADEKSGASSIDVSLPGTPIFLRRDEMQKLWYWRELSQEERNAHLDAIVEWSANTPLSRSPLRDLAVRLRWSMEQRASPQAPAEATASQLRHVRDTILEDIRAVQEGYVPSDIAEHNLDHLREMYAAEMEVFDAIEDPEDWGQFEAKVEQAFDAAILRAEGKDPQAAEPDRMREIVESRGLHYRQQTERAGELLDQRWEALAAYNAAIGAQAPPHWRTQVPLDDPANRVAAAVSAETAFLMKQGRDTEVHGMELARDGILRMLDQLGDEWRILLEPAGFGIKAWFPSIYEAGFAYPATRGHEPFKDVEDAKAWIRKQYADALAASMTDAEIAELTTVTADDIIRPRRLEVPEEPQPSEPAAPEVGVDPQATPGNMSEVRTPPVEEQQQASVGEAAPEEVDEDALVAQINAVRERLDRIRNQQEVVDPEEQAALAAELQDLENQFYRSAAEVTDDEMGDAITEALQERPLNSDDLNFAVSQIVRVRPSALTAKLDAHLMLATIGGRVVKDGAMYRDPQWVPPEPEAGPRAPQTIEFAPDATPEEKILAVLQTGPAGVDELAQRIQEPESVVRGQVTALHFQGDIIQEAGVLRLPPGKVTSQRADLGVDTGDLSALAHRLIEDRVILNKVQEEEKLVQKQDEAIVNLQSGDLDKARAAIAHWGIYISQMETEAVEELKGQGVLKKIGDVIFNPDRYQRLPGWHPVHSEAFRNSLNGAANWTSTWGSAARRAIEGLDPEQLVALTWYMSMKTTRTVRTPNDLGLRPGDRISFTREQQLEVLLRELNEKGDPADYLKDGDFVNLPKRAAEVIEAEGYLAKLYDGIYYGDIAGKPVFPSMAELSAELAEITGDKGMAWQPGYIGSSAAPDPRYFDEKYLQPGLNQASIEQVTSFTNPAEMMLKFVGLTEKAVRTGHPDDMEAARQFLPAVRADFFIERYAGNIKYLMTRKAIYSLVMEYFPTVDQVEALVGPEAVKTMTENGWGPVRAGTTELKGLEEFFVPPAVRRLIEAKFLEAEAEKTMTHLQAILGVAKLVFRVPQIWLLKSLNFLNAQILELATNLWTMGVFGDRYGTTWVRAMALNNRVLMQALLEEHELVPYKRPADRLKVAIAQAHEAVWRQLGAEHDQDLIRQYIQEARDYGLYTTSFSVAGRNELERFAEAAAKRFYRWRGLGRVARNVAAVEELTNTLFFGLDSIGRGTGYIALRLMGNSAEEARRVIRDHTVEYMENLMSDVGGALSKLFWYWTYRYERAHQFPTMFARYPYLAVTAAEAKRKSEQWAGWDAQWRALLTGRAPFLQTAIEYIPMPYNSYWLKDVRMGPAMIEHGGPADAGGGNRVVFARWRIPLWEELGEYQEWFHRPSSTVQESMVPLVQMAQAGEDYGDLGYLLRAIPIVGRTMSQARRVTYADQLDLSGRARLSMLGLGPEPMTREEAERLYEIGQVPEWCQAHGADNTRGPKITREADRREYEIDMMLYYADIFYASSRHNVSLYPMRVSDMVNNMTPADLRRAIRATQLKVDNGIPTLVKVKRLEEELEQREEGVGPQNVFDQTLSVWRGTAAEVIPLLAPATGTR